MSLMNFGHRTARLALAGAALAIFGGALGAGCGGGYDTSSLGGFCQAMAAADCSPNVVQQCYLASEGMIETDTNSCILARSQAKNCNPSNLPYHPEWADNCLATHGAVYSQTQIDITTFKQIAQACLATFNRGGQQGQTCTQDVDCDVGNGLFCMVRVGGKGTCQVPTPVEAGQSCNDPAAQCPDGMFCDTGFHCVAIGGAASVCGAGQPCGDGFRCNNQLHQCEAQLPDQATCKGDSDCAGGFCVGVSSTNPAGKCASTLIFAFGSAVCAPFDYHH